MALVLPVTCSAFYVYPQVAEENFNYPDWHKSSQDHSSWRESENYISRTLVYEGSTLEFGVNTESNCPPGDSSPSCNKDQTLVVESVDKRKSETCETTGNRKEGVIRSAQGDHGSLKELSSTTSSACSSEQGKDCNTWDEIKMIKDNVPAVNSHKRKLDFEELHIADEPPRKISMRDNTPRQRRDEKKRILKMSVQKLRKMEDPEVFLHRAVLLNNTMKRMQREIKEEKRRLIFGESIENITFPKRIVKDCQFERDVLCDSQNTNVNSSFYDHCFDFHDYRQSSDRVADDIYSEQQGLHLDAIKNEHCKHEHLALPVEKGETPVINTVFDNFMNSLSET